MTASDFCKAADRLYDDCIKLSEAKSFESAMYLAGLALECALKVVVLRAHVHKATLPDKGVEKVLWSHDLQSLLKLSAINITGIGNPLMTANLQIVEKWAIKFRYAPESKAFAKQMIYAVTDAHTGIYHLVKTHW